jgi:fructokinase
VPDLAVADTVGAGDAYAAILTLGYLKGWHPEKILEAASRFSAAICTIKGALPGSDGFYDPFRGMLKDDDDVR